MLTFFVFFDFVFLGVVNFFDFGADLVSFFSSFLLSEAFFEESAMFFSFSAFNILSASSFNDCFNW